VRQRIQRRHAEQRTIQRHRQSLHRRDSDAQTRKRSRACADRQGIDILQRDTRELQKRRELCRQLRGVRARAVTGILAHQIVIAHQRTAARAARGVKGKEQHRLTDNIDEFTNLRIDGFD
jgi:hypothetical protein